MDSVETKIEVETRDHQRLWLTVFPSDLKRSKNQTVLVSGASGVPQRFYAKFSRFLAQEGFDVVTFDFRTIGLSKVPDMKADQSTFIEWGSIDIPTLIQFCRERWPTQKIKVVGHSGGAWLMAINPLWDDVSGMYAVASGSLYWKLMSSPERYRLFFIWKFMVPFVTRVFDYAPAWMGLGVDLTKAHANQWAKWSLDPNGAFGDEKYCSLFSNPSVPITVASIYDDKWETEPAVRNYYDRLTRAKVSYQKISEADALSKPVGHFGFFKEVHQMSLWPFVMDWLIR